MEAWLGPAAGTAARRPGGHFGRRNSRYPNSSKSLPRQPFISLSPYLVPSFWGWGRNSRGQRYCEVPKRIPCTLCLNFVTDAVDFACSLIDPIPWLQWKLAVAGSPVTRGIVRPQGGSLCLATVICDVFLCAYCHNRVRQRLLLREQFGEELEPRLAPWMPSFIIHSIPIWLGALLWVSHCPSSSLGSLRPRGGKIQLGG